jgi:CBS domain containing-hemolysin-like protein
MSEPVALLIGVLLLGLNAFFVGAEFALISARRSTIEPLAEAGGRAARTTLGAMEQVSLMLAGAQLGITICSLGLGYIAKPAISDLLKGPLGGLGVPEGLEYPIAFAVALTVVAVLHVVIGEMVPKNVALARPDRSALVLSPILRFVVRILRPAIASLNWIANTVLRLAGVEPKDEVTSAFTRDEVAGLVDESRREGLIEPNQEHLLLGALQFEERDVRSVLLPAAELETVTFDVTPEQVEQLAARTGYSRFPVRDGDGALAGYLHLKDALEVQERHRRRPIARRWVRPLPPVAATDSLRHVLAEMQRTGAHLAQVRAGEQVVGVAALEDVLEELVGEIRDETRNSAG